MDLIFAPRGGWGLWEGEGSGWSIVACDIMINRSNGKFTSPQNDCTPHMVSSLHRLLPTYCIMLLVPYIQFLPWVEKRVAIGRVTVTILAEKLVSVIISARQSPSSCFLVCSVCHTGIGILMWVAGFGD